MSQSERHEFAVYYDDLSQSGDRLVSTDRQVAHRIAQILRLRVGDSLILFDRKVWVQATLSEVSPRRIAADLAERQAIIPLAPPITLGLSLLKRVDLERALYSAVELGATEIQLLETAKSARSSAKGEFDRLERVMIAAAEQSKNFAIPLLNAAQPLTSWLAAQSTQSAELILFHPDGQSLASLFSLISSKKQESMVLVVGPEGDFISDEQAQLQVAGFLFCALTPTILRAHQAVAVGLGAIRSLCR